MAEPSSRLEPTSSDSVALELPSLPREESPGRQRPRPVVKATNRNSDGAPAGASSSFTMEESNLGDDEEKGSDNVTNFFVKEVELDKEAFVEAVQSFHSLVRQTKRRELTKAHHTPGLWKQKPKDKLNRKSMGRREPSTSVLDLPKPTEQNASLYLRNSRSCMGLPIISPFGRNILIWRWTILALDATYAAFLVPISTALVTTDMLEQSEGDGGPGGLSWADWLVVVTGVLYAADIIIQFHVAWIGVNQELKQILIVDGRKISKLYFHDGFVFDFVCLLPSILQIVQIIMEQAGADSVSTRILSWFRVLRLLRFLRVFRICKTDFLTKVAGGTDGISPSLSTLIMLLYFVAFLVNLLGCLWYIIGSVGGYGNSWLLNKSIYVKELDPDGNIYYDLIPLADAGAGSKYLASLYWATTTVTTVGYGDITPTNNVEMVVNIAVMFMGVMIFGLMINSLADVFVTNSRDAKRVQRIQDRVQESSEWMTVHHVKKDLRQKVRDFYTQSWSRGLKKDNQEAALLYELPYSLRAEVAYSILRESVQKAPQTILRALPDAFQRLLLVNIRPSTVLAGCDLHVEGSPASCVWLLHSGEMLNICQFRPSALQGGPAYLGSMDLIHVLLNGSDAIGFPSFLGFRALSLCSVWEIRLENFTRIMDAFPSTRLLLLQSAQAFLESSIENPTPFRRLNELMNTQHKSVSAEIERLNREHAEGINQSSCIDLNELIEIEAIDTSSFFEPSAQDIEVLRQAKVQREVALKLKQLTRKRHVFREQPPTPWGRLRQAVVTGSWRTVLLADTSFSYGRGNSVDLFSSESFPLGIAAPDATAEEPPAEQSQPLCSQQ